MSSFSLSADFVIGGSFTIIGCGFFLSIAGDLSRVTFLCFFRFAGFSLIMVFSGKASVFGG